jgi:hypothetical protein
VLADVLGGRRERQRQSGEQGEGSGRTGHEDLLELSQLPCRCCVAAIAIRVYP